MKSSPNRYRPIDHAPSVLAATLAVVLAASLPAAGHDWEVRRALAPDQVPDWTAAGYLPAWDVTIGDDGRGFRIAGDGHGRCRGTVLVATPVELPDPLPPGFQVGLRYKTFCAQNRPPRSGTAVLAFYAMETWRRFDSSLQPALKFDVRQDDQKPLCQETIAPQGEDVLQWCPWQSGELRHLLRPYAGQTVMLAIAWSAHHFHVEEWAEFDRVQIVARTEDELTAEFYESLDLKRPELSAVAEAVQRADWKEAARGLASHYRRRKTPPPPPLAKSGSVPAAEKIVDHVFSFVGCPPHRLPPEIQWNEDPFDYEQWAISLNRHAHWKTLGAAYAGTKDERYAREFVAQLRSWIDRMPVAIGRHFVEGPYSVPGKSPLSLDAGIRMAQSWFPAFYYFLPSPSFTDDDVVAMLRSFRRHAVYLMEPRHFRSGSNWGAMEAAGLLYLGCMLPEFRDAPSWRGTAIERLYKELDLQVYPDGAQMELTPGYHGVTLGNLLAALEVARRTETELPDDFVARLERMFDYYVRIAMPDRSTPPLNDSGTGGVQGYLREGLALFPRRDDFRYLATGGEQGTPPSYTSTRLPYAGWHVMRSGWQTDACYLLLDAGPFGTGHQHEDKLSILVHAFGRLLICEAGRYSYDDSPWRRYVLSTRAHNTIMVDGLDQRHSAVRESFQTDRPVDTTWISTETLDFASGDYTLGYGRAENVPVQHRRSVLFIKPRLWLVVDRVHPADDLPHKVESLFHLDAPDVEVDPATGAVVTTNPTGPNVALLPVGFDGWQIEIVQGQTEPVVQGWMPTLEHNELRPVPTAVYRRETSGDTVMACLIAPLKPGDAVPRVTPMPLRPTASSESFALEVIGADAARYTILCNGRPGTELSASGLQTAARVAIFGGDDSLVAEIP